MICCRRSWWLCLLDQYILRCHVKRFCNMHDRYIVGDFYEEDEPVEKIRAAFNEGQRNPTTPTA